MMFYSIGDAAHTTPHLFSIVEDFGNMSGYQINWAKSTVLPLNDVLRWRLYKPLFLTIKI